MTDKRKSTPPQQEHKKEGGLPVPIWFIVLLGAVMTAVAFGPSILAGISEGGIGTDTDSGIGDTGTDPVAVETEKPSDDIAPAEPTVKVVSVSGTTVKLEITNTANYYYRLSGVGVYTKVFGKKLVWTEISELKPGEKISVEWDVTGALPATVKEIQVTGTWIVGNHFKPEHE